MGQPRDPPWPLHRRVVKRAFDVVVSAAALAILAVPLVALGLLVRLTSPGPALDRQLRVGRGGRLFSLLKLRTLRGPSPRGFEPQGAGDPRVTRLGRLLRRARLDLLPQLVNVLAGDMSLVGPRPEPPRHVAAYGVEDRVVLSVRPGLTDPGSIALRDAARVLTEYADPERAYVDVVLPYKLALSREYVATQRFTRDLALLLRALAAL